MTQTKNNMNKDFMYRERKYHIQEVTSNEWNWCFYKEDGETVDKKGRFIGHYEFMENIVCRAIDRTLGK